MQQNKPNVVFFYMYTILTRNGCLRELSAAIPETDLVIAIIARTLNNNNNYYYFGVRCARPGESEDTLSVQRPQPHTTNPCKEEKDKTDKKERADHANRKALALLLKPGSPTPSNTGSLRSFQRDTERGTKLLQY